MEEVKTFNPKDKVIKRIETDPRNYGSVMDIPASHVKPGYIAVYFQRQVWIKPENLMHFNEWQKKKRDPQGSLKDYWARP